MSADDASLPDDLATAHLQLREQAETLRRQGLLIAKLQHQLEQLLRRMHGKKGEAADPAQLLLFAPEVIEPPAPGPTPDAKPAPATPRNGGRKPLPASLPRKRIVHDVASEDRACPECGLDRRKIGEETREQLEYIPASLVVLEHVRKRFANYPCDVRVHLITGSSRQRARAALDDARGRRWIAGRREFDAHEGPASISIAATSRLDLNQPTAGLSSLRPSAKHPRASSSGMKREQILDLLK